jgi:leucyl-tRNA synthetase
MNSKKSYDHRAIEKKWQDFWEDNKTFKAKINTDKPKYYVLDMFPYPSGSGLHVGHVEGYTATDILARYKRHKGFNVLHPMGWDSFGLPAEQYAIRTGTHPAVTTKSNINNYRRQLKSLGFSFDWEREISTSDPKYYKWTQWIFTKLYEKGLAYESKLPVNYCPALGTVLANEEVEEGMSKEGGHPVERRLLRQWVLKITAYADRLISDLELVDWPESLKRHQINWIGRSEGANVLFKETTTNKDISVFTTRPDTLFGATYMVLAPEHPLIEEAAPQTHKEQIKEYQKKAAQKNDLERTELNKDKTGVFTGLYAINPVNNKKIPIWISDYVLISYGTGAIMAVPAHDERDFEFAQKYSLEITPVYDPHVGSQADLIPEGISTTQYRKQVLDGEACWTGEGTCINSKNDEISIEDLCIKEAKKLVSAWLEKKGFGSFCVNYKLRDWLFSRQRYWGEPFPLIELEDGSKRALTIDELPLSPPEIEDYKPSGEGLSPLAKVPQWVHIHDTVTNSKAKRETNTMPQWAGSCWYYLRFCDPNNEGLAWDKDKENYWMPVDMYVGGVEHAVLHLLYARFWHKVLYDCGLVSTPEPFQTLRNQGLITAPSYQRENGLYVEPHEAKEENGNFFLKETNEPLKVQVEKMSKSKLNGVIPDHIVDELGADSLRLYEMFMGPLEKEKIWNTKAVMGCRRFLVRFFDLIHSDKVSDSPAGEEALKLGNRLLHGVSKDIDNMQFNTAIAKMMEFLNNFTKLDKFPKEILNIAVLCLSPFAPHLSEELWVSLGNEPGVSYTSYPKVNKRYLEEDNATYIIQINGRLRARYELPKDQEEEILIEKAQKDPAVAKFLTGVTIKKIVYVPNRLLNIVAN